MAEWASGDVIANGIRIHYYRTGGAKPPVVLSHGVTDSGLCWTPVARRLEADYDVIMYDARGHGLSEAPERGYSADDRAADLAGLIEALGLDRPRLIGHSMGGETTTYAAANYPSLVRCAVLEDPPFSADLYPDSPERLAAHVAALRSDILRRRSLSREELIAAGRAEHPEWSEAELLPWAEAKRQVRPEVANRRRDVPREPWQKTLAKIACPVLLITADPERGARITPEVAQEAQALLPSARVIHLAGAGHNVRREQFEAYVAAVRAFLAEV